MKFSIGPAGLACALAAAPLAAQPAATAAMQGDWITADKRGQIRIERCSAGDARLCGTLVWMQPAPGDATIDVNNPDPAKRNRPLLGMQVLTELTPEPDGRLRGKAYNSDDGRTYDITVRTKGPQIEVQGCVLGFLCSSETWTRLAAQEAPGGAPGGAPKTAAGKPKP
jgi:uncharacterized protein (DUF2147 family)